MQTKRRTDIRCVRRTMLADLGIPEDRPSDTTANDTTAPETSGPGCGCVQCADPQWDVQRLKYWLASRLLAYGADEAVVDGRIGTVMVDVFWKLGARSYAIEVRSGPLTQELAQKHTDRLRSLGADGVLWLCAPGYWVSQLPALGIADLDPQACDYRILGGMLELGPEGLVVPRTRSDELREFLRQWVSGEVAWGWRDDFRKGWAAVTDWEQHTRTQALMLERQRHELMAQRTALAVSRQSVRSKNAQIAKLTARVERTMHYAQEQAEAVAAVRRRMADQERVHAALKDTIRRLHTTIDHWQVITVFVMLLLTTFITATLVLAP